MVIIGELLNSSRPAVRGAMAKQDKTYLLEQAGLQVRAGAKYLDINAAALLGREKETLRWIVPLVQEAVEVPLSIDTPDPAAMEVALSVHQDRALLNSLSGERDKADQILALIGQYRPRVIVLCLDDRGPATTPDRALAIAERMVNHLHRRGLGLEDIFIDPLVHSIAADPRAAARFLDALRRIKRYLPGVRTVGGISNISFGLPRRRLLNRMFLVLALEAGLDSAICNPLEKDFWVDLALAEALLGLSSDRERFRRAGLKKAEKPDRREEPDRRD